MNYNFDLVEKSADDSDNAENDNVFVHKIYTQKFKIA